jgi:hypothetical protein
MMIAGSAGAGIPAIAEAQADMQQAMSQEGPLQDYIVYKDGDQTVARGQYDREVLLRNRSAAEVLQEVCDHLDEQGGGEVVVGTGTYLIEHPIMLPARTTFRGRGRATVFKLGSENAEADGKLFIADGKDHLTVANFTCQGVASNDSSAGVVFHKTGLSTIRNVYARDFSGYGFWIRENSFAVKLENNMTSGNDGAGTLIETTQYSRGGRFFPNKIIGGYSYAENGHGFEFQKAICQDMVSCVAYLPKGHGIYMHGESTSNLISGCRIFMGHRNGITIESTHEMNISSNICGWNRGHNLELDHCVWGTVSANEFIDAGGRANRKYGIYMHRGTKAMQISDNAIFNWWDNQIMKGGIYESEDCLENQITDNTINYYEDEAVYSAGEDSVTDFNLALPHAYVSPHKGPFAGNVEPEKLREFWESGPSAGIDRPWEIAQEFLDETRL